MIPGRWPGPGPGKRMTLWAKIPTKSFDGNASQRWITLLFPFSNRCQKHEIRCQKQELPGRRRLN